MSENQNLSSLEEAFEQVSQAQIALIKSKEALETVEKLDKHMTEALRNWQTRYAEMRDEKNKLASELFKQQKEYEKELKFIRHKFEIIEKLIARGVCDKNEAKLISEVLQAGTMEQLDKLNAAADANIKAYKNTCVTPEFYDQLEKFEKLKNSKDAIKVEHKAKDFPKDKAPENKEELVNEFFGLLGKILGNVAEIRVVEVGGQDDKKAC